MDEKLICDSYQFEATANRVHLQRSFSITTLADDLPIMQLSNSRIRIEYNQYKAFKREEYSIYTDWTSSAKLAQNRLIYENYQIELYGGLHVQAATDRFSVASGKYESTTMTIYDFTYLGRLLL